MPDETNGKRDPIELHIIDEGGKTLFEQGDRYIIPLYQRSFAWKDPEIEQLIDDIDSIDGDSSTRYYLGSLVVNRNAEGRFEVIDGQQRLTALFILLARLGYPVCSIDPAPLAYASRKQAGDTLRRLGELEELQDFDNSEFDLGIAEGWGAVRDKIEELRKHPGAEGSRVEDFKKKLRKVALFRIEVPQGTDLNHYFEIMNTRGEQLEQHESLKGKLMGLLEKSNDDEKTKRQRQSAFAAIWDACSNMDEYVQRSFTPGKEGTRHKLFGSDWNTVPSKEKIDTFAETFSECDGNATIPTIGEIINEPLKRDEAKDPDNDDDKMTRYESIIRFPVFLLHVLKVFERSEARNGELGDQIADTHDRKLLESFRSAQGRLRETGKDEADFAWDFLICLLQCRFLFDKYIIKRRFTHDKPEGEWSLVELYGYPPKEDKSRQLQYRGTRCGTAKDNESKDEATECGTAKDNEPEDEVDSAEVRAENPDAALRKEIRMLQSCLRVSHTSPRSMAWITKVLCELYKKDEKDVKEPSSLADLRDYCENIIRAEVRNEKDALEGKPLGTATPHIALNYLDYLLWKQDGHSDFEFEFRSSVEHWYPQHPEDLEPWDDVDRLGNLCLVHRRENSKFSNLNPKAKKDEYGERIKTGSLKLRKMAAYFSEHDADDWRNGGCEEHEREMLGLLNEAVRASSATRGETPAS